MDKELDIALVRDFPLLYRNRHAKVTESCMGWGFSCGNGWEPLIRKLSEKLEPLIKEFPEDDRPVVEQVKEKFGGLRFYISHATSEMWTAIEEAEKQSYTICESCSAPGEVRGGSWIRTLCDSCHAT